MANRQLVLLVLVTSLCVVTAIKIDFDDSNSELAYSRRFRRQSDPHGDCPNQWFPCGNTTQCVSQDKHCDGEPDCDNGADEDEEDCDDEGTRNAINFLFATKDDSSEARSQPSCNETSYPSVCECYVVPGEEEGDILGLNLFCHLADLDTVPEGLPSDTIYLNLAGNRFTELTEDMFTELTKLKRLELQDNRITTIDPATFDALEELEYLDLSSNKISEFPKEMFYGIYNLKTLRFRHNPIRRLVDVDLFLALPYLETLTFFGAEISELRSGVFAPLTRLKKLVLAYNRLEAVTQCNVAGLGNLTSLDLQYNDIRLIENGAFTESPLLEELRLHGNKIEVVKPGMFENLPNLRALLLDKNQLRIIEPGSFAKLSSLEHITIAQNELTNLTVGMFDGLSRVTNLGLFGNKIEYMENGTFAPLINVETLDLVVNPFREVPRGIFDIMPKLGHIYFDHFFLCGYAPRVKDCNPKGDGLSNSEDLLGTMVLRVAVWMVSILATFGNIIVLLARCVTKDDNKVHSFFIVNLAVSDFLMGAYLFIIAIHDVVYRGSYIQHDVDWRSSWVCKLCGAFSLLSSEMSVFTLTIITADRYFCIVHPFRFRSRAILPAAVLMGVLWLVGIALAALPVVHTSYFGDYFYGANGVCLPLQFDRPFDDGWVFTLFVFVVANLLSFLFIAYAYARIFLTIHRSNHAMRSTKASQDLALLKRFSIIIATDFLCWMPIIIVKFLTYVIPDMHIPPAAHAWFAIFILPVNSALNPVLYTMTTRQFKRMIFHPSRALMGKSKTAGGNESQSVSHTRGREMANTATSRLSVISHAHVTKNGTPTTPRSNKAEDIQPVDEEIHEHHEEEEEQAVNAV